MQPFHKFEVGVGEARGVGEAAIAPILFRLPGVPLHRQAQSAEFSEHSGTLRFRFRRGRPGIVVQVVHVAHAPVGPAAGVVHKPRRITFLRQIHDARRVELPPPFVERHPHDNARMVEAFADDGFPFGFKLRCGFGRTREVGVVAANIFVTARHILPDQQPQFVTPVIPAIRLYLYVFASEVEAKLFCHLDVVAQRLVCWRGVKSIWPKALIQRAELK